MATVPASLQDELFYNDAARAYLASLPLEHFMETYEAGFQRAVTLASFELIRAARPDVRYFNELCVQYPQGDLRDIGRVVPDNMVVVYAGEVRASVSYNTPFEAADPFLMIEYVSEGDPSKDTVDNLRRYQDDLKVPYYLMFEPIKKEINLFKRNARTKKYQTVKPNRHGRSPIPKLEVEVGMAGDWMRYWFRGELVPLPVELAAELDRTKSRLREVERRATDAEQRATDAEQRATDAARQAVAAERQAAAERDARAAADAELARLRAELDRLRGERGPPDRSRGR